MAGSRHIGRALGIAAVVSGTAALAVALVGDRGGYRVHARFDDASLLVKGNEVRVAGRSVGSVERLTLTRKGRADVLLRIDDDLVAPLRRGTEAVVRQASLAGVANRYVDLRLPGAGAAPIPDGGVIAAADTQSAVDLDQLFNTFDARTRRALSSVVRGSARTWRGRSRAAREGLLMLDPASASARRLLEELGGDTPALERFLVGSSRLVTHVAARRDDVAAIVDDLAGVTTTTASRSAALGETIDRLPALLRRGNTTFVDLRAALDDVEPVVRLARPAVRRLAPVLGAVQELASDAGPVLRDTAAAVRRPGTDNDLVDALDALPAVRDAAVRPVRVAGHERQATFPATARALTSMAPRVGYIRPYAPEVTGWLDDFAYSGIYDAMGGTGRIAMHANAFTSVGGLLTLVPASLRAQVFDRVAVRGQRRRCPGALERGTAYKPTPDFNCDLSQVPPGR